MKKLVAANLVLVGIVIGFIMSAACSNSVASDPVECLIDGPIEVEVVSSATSPVAVMVCDGMETSGLCAEVYISGSGGSHILNAN